MNMCGEHRGSRAQWLPEPLPECASPLWIPPWERSVQPLGTRMSNALPLIEGRNRSPSVFRCALITRTPEDECPAVHPNAGPFSQMTSQVLGRGHGLPSCLSICVTCEAQSPSPVLCSSVLTPWLCPLLTTLGSVHCFPLWHGATWAVHSLWVPWLASGVAVRTALSVWNATGGVGRGVGNVVASPWRNKHPQQKPRGLKSQVDADTTPSTGVWSAVQDALEKHMKQG